MRHFRNHQLELQEIFPETQVWTILIHWRRIAGVWKDLRWNWNQSRCYKVIFQGSFFGSLLGGQLAPAALASWYHSQATEQNLHFQWPDGLLVFIACSTDTQTFKTNLWFWITKATIQLLTHSSSSRRQVRVQRHHLSFVRVDPEPHSFGSNQLFI